MTDMGNIQSMAEKMSISSSAYNDSDTDPHVIGHPCFCFFGGPGKIIFTIFNVIHTVTLLPLCTWILHFGFQQLQKKRRTSSAATISHWDIFTYHMVVMELIGVLGFILCLSGNFTNQDDLFTSGLFMYSFTMYGQLFFHILTSAEHYLAVVHPITYLGMKNEKGIRIRNVIIGWIWLLCCAIMGFRKTGLFIYLDMFFNILSTLIIFFCCVSILFVLIRPSPGQESREGADQYKQRAFYTIVVILGVLMLRLCFGLVWTGLDVSRNMARCLTMVLTVGVNLPSSLVLPLFLQRTGKLICCKKE